MLKLLKDGFGASIHISHFLDTKHRGPHAFVYLLAKSFILVKFLPYDICLPLKVDDLRANQHQLVFVLTNRDLLLIEDVVSLPLSPFFVVGSIANQPIEFLYTMDGVFH